MLIYERTFHKHERCWLQRFIYVPDQSITSYHGHSNGRYRY